MALVDEKEVGRRRKSEDSAGEPNDRPSKKKRSNAPAVGHALKSAYQQTVNEDIPPEMLDLLGKLG